MNFGCCDFLLELFIQIANIIDAIVPTDPINENVRVKADSKGNSTLATDL